MVWGLPLHPGDRVSCRFVPIADADIEKYAAFAEALDHPTGPVEDTTDLRAVADTVRAVEADEALLREKVELARANGRSWGRIGLALGVTRQSARERFGEKASA